MIDEKIKTVERHGDAYTVAADILDELGKQEDSPGFVLIFPDKRDEDTVRVISNMDDRDVQAVLGSLSMSMRMRQSN